MRAIALPWARWGTLVDVAARVWQSSWLSAAVLVPFAGLVVWGLLTGARELGDADAQVRVRQHYLRTSLHDVSITGRATYLGLLQERLRTELIGPFTLDLDCRDGLIQPGQLPRPDAVLHLELIWENSRVGDTWQVTDPASGMVLSIESPVAYRTVIEVPMPQGHQQLRFVPSDPAQGARIAELKVTSDKAVAGPMVRHSWRTVHDNGVTSAAIGAGFGPFPQNGTRLLTRRTAYMNLKTTRPGRHVLRWSFRRPDPQAAMPVVTLGRHRIFPAADPALGCLHTEQGLTTIELRLDLADGDNWMGIECPGRILSPWELGHSQERNRYAYEIELASCVIAPEQH
jgi:hypothetical protein